MDVGGTICSIIMVACLPTPYCPDEESIIIPTRNATYGM